MNRPIPYRPDYSALAQNEQRSWHRAIAARALVAKPNEDTSKLAAELAKSAWPGDERAHLILRAGVSPTTTADLWTYSPVAPYRSLAPSSAALALFQLGLVLNLEGVTTIRIPSVAGLPAQPIFVGEGLPAPNLQWNFATDTVLGPARKILMLSAVTADLQKATGDTAANVIGRVLADKATRDIDATAFGTAAADDKQPAGLLHGVTPIAAATAGVGAMTEDLGALTGAIGAAGIDPSGVVFVAGPREAMIIKASVGSKFDHTVLMTLGLPAKSVAAFAPAGVVSGFQDNAPTIETAKEAAYHFSDTPADISSSGSVAAPVKSMWQTDIISIRVRANCAWAVATGAAQVITAVNW